jgi:hypothetical protein
VNAGVVLAGFNDPDSAWPYQGSAPDIGAYEVDVAARTVPVDERGTGRGAVPLAGLAGMFALLTGRQLRQRSWRRRISS